MKVQSLLPNLHSAGVRVPQCGKLAAMDAKSLRTLELPKVLELLAGYCAFTPSAERALALQPTGSLETARRLQAEVTEARALLESMPHASIGGARDIRERVEGAARGIALTPADLLDVKATLVSARSLGRTFERHAESYPHLFEISRQLPPAIGLVDAISRAISDRGEVLDSASDRLASVRSELRVAHDRLLTRLQRMVNNPEVAQYLQDNLVTQRDGRYVLPLRAEFKGRIKAVVHDQSASGATLFIEPLSVVELNNRYRELQLAERDEIRRVLAELTARVGERSAELLQIVDVLSSLDLALARARLADHLGAVEPVLLPFQKRRVSGAARPKDDAATPERHPGSTLRLLQARHPLLDPATVVPIDLELDPQTYALVITGPNTGGKTVSLKTAGLLCLMAQSGLHIPALEGSSLTVFEQIFADIGDEQSIEQSLSTFSGHITNIIRILDQAGPRSLVILDELGAGTDPQEGAALAQAILAHLLDKSVTNLVATHFPALKAYAHGAPGVVNASVEFDDESLRPTYRLVIGLPGRSNALAIARRLGLSPDIIDQARGGLDPADVQADDLLDEIHRQRDQARQARIEAEAARRGSQALRAELAGRLEQIENERLEILEAARQEAEAQLAAVREELNRLHEILDQAPAPADEIPAAAAALIELEAELEERVAHEPMSELALEELDIGTRPLRAGDRVRLRRLGTVGTVGAVDEDDAEVHIGNLRVRARVWDLELVAKEDPDASPEAGRPPVDPKSSAAAGAQRSADDHDGLTRVSGAARPSVEIDLRGRRVDEALDELDTYLDAAYLAAMPFVRLIHGKGTGRLREAIRQELGRHPHVSSFETGQPGEGGDGVTVVKFVP